jgi:hypothetical protein
VLCGRESPDAVDVRWQLASLVAAHEREQWHEAPDVEITDPAASIRWCCECSVAVLPKGTDGRRLHCDSCRDRFRAEGKSRRASAASAASAAAAVAPAR